MMIMADDGVGKREKKTRKKDDEDKQA